METLSDFFRSTSRHLCKVQSFSQTSIFHAAFYNTVQSSLLSRIRHISANNFPAGSLLYIADTWHDDSYSGGSGRIIMSRIRSSLGTDDHSHVIVPCSAELLCPVWRKRHRGLILCIIRCSDLNSGRDAISRCCRWVSTYQRYRHGYRFAHIWIPTYL